MKPLPTALTEKQIARFWNKVDKTDGCWNWTGAHNKHGYGVVVVDRVRYGAHRISCGAEPFTEKAAA